MRNGTVDNQAEFGQLLTHSGPPRKFSVSGRSRQPTKVAVAADARWRHQGGARSSVYSPAV
jgi:hypothetical protein